MPTYYADFDLGDGNNDGSSWANAFRTEAAFESFLETPTIAAGDYVYIMQSTCTLDSGWSFSSVDGTGTSPICFIGVKDGTTAEPPTYSDWADGNLSGGSDERPLFACGANSWAGSDYTKWINIRWSISQTTGINFGGAVFLYNCKVVQNSSASNRYGIYLSGGDCFAILSEACGEVGVGVVGQLFRISTNCVLFCSAHDGLDGVYLNAIRNGVLFSTIEDCSGSGINFAALTQLILNNTFNDCATGITGGANDGTRVINNILEGCTTDGIIWTTQTDSNFFWKNHGNDTRNNDMWDGVATSGIHSDLETTTGDPLFDGDGNLSLQSSSPCKNNALSAILGT